MSDAPMSDAAALARRWLTSSGLPTGRRRSWWSSWAWWRGRPTSWRSRSRTSTRSARRISPRNSAAASVQEPADGAAAPDGLRERTARATGSTTRAATGPSTAMISTYVVASAASSPSTAA